MHAVHEFLNSLAEVAGKPLAFLGYVLLLVCWCIAYIKRTEVRELLKKIEAIPEEDRRKTVENTLGDKVPERISADQWLKRLRQRYIFVAYIATIFAVVVLSAFAYINTKANIEIDDVTKPIYSGMLPKAYAEDVPTTRAELRKWGVEKTDKIYPFEIRLRNPSDQVVNVTDIRVIFDPSKSGGLLNVEEVSGVYVTRVKGEGDATTTGPGKERYEAYAWYPNGKGTLHVKTPIKQKLRPNTTDRFRVIIAFPQKYNFKGPMREAILHVYWNKNEYITSSEVALSSRK